MYFIRPLTRRLPPALRALNLYCAFSTAYIVSASCGLDSIDWRHDERISRIFEGILYMKIHNNNRSRFIAFCQQPSHILFPPRLRYIVFALHSRRVAQLSLVCALHVLCCVRHTHSHSHFFVAFENNHQHTREREQYLQLK